MLTTPRGEAELSALTVGLIGAGAIGRVHAQCWLDLGVELRVWSDLPSDDFVASFPATSAPPRISAVSDLAELLAAADVIDICSPTPSHLTYVRAAAQAGCHVICEKPLGRTTEEAAAAVHTVTDAGVQLYPAHVVRYFPEYAASRAALRSGRLGAPAVIRFTRGSAAPVSDWFFDDARSGGIVMDQLIHDLDQARWMAGEVTEVYAVQNPATVDGVVPRAVVALVTLTHANGAVSQIQGSWGPPGVPFRTALSVAGATGRVQHSSSAPSTLVERLAPNAEAVDYLPVRSAEESPYLTELRECAEAFTGGPPPRVTAADGVMAVALAEAARASITSGRPVPFDAAAITALTRGVAR